jgi:hypothetical protein
MITPQYTDEEKNALRGYQMDPYLLNSKLRDDTATISDCFKMQIQRLDSALKKSKQDEPVTLYRATFLKDIEKRITGNGNDRYLEYPAYMSTAIMKYRIVGIEIQSLLKKHFNSIFGYQGENTPVLLTIHCPTDFELVPIYKILDSSEYEVLIGRNREFKIVEEKRDISYSLQLLFDNFVPKECKQLFHYELVAINKGN